MLIRDIASGRHGRAMDRSILCELLHPKNESETGDLPCSIAHAIVPPGETTAPHRLRTATEFYYILSGSGRMHINNETNDVRAGQIVLIPAGAIQFLENTGNCDLCFLCIVAPPWQECDEELVAV